MANIGFEDQHLERIDGLELIEKKMWEEYNKEKEPFKRVQILKDIAQVQPYLSSYYEATKYVIDKDKCKKRLSGKIIDITQIQETNDIDEAIIDERRSDERSRRGIQKTNGKGCFL